MTVAGPPVALVCDLDMTLIDSRRDIAAAVAYAATGLGRRTVLEKEVFPWIGKGLRVMLAGLLDDLDDDKLETLTQAYKDRFFDHCAVHTTVYPGVVKTLRALHDRGVPVAIATAKMTFMARRVCEVFGLDKLVDHIQGTDGLPGKPDPAVVLAACQALGVPSDQAVMVGDTVMDMQAARRAGCRAVGVTYGIGGRAALEAEAPELIVDAFEDILSLFSDSTD